MSDFESAKIRNADPWFTALSRLGQIGVLLVDKDGEIEFASERAMRLLNCENDVSLEECTRDLVKPLTDALGEATQCGVKPNDTRPYAFEVDVDGKGVATRLRCELHPVDVEGCHGHLLLLQDVEAQELAEQDLRLATRMRNMGRLYQAMAHNLRTPVAAIYLFNQMLANLLNHPPGSEVEMRQKGQNCLDNIREAANMLEQSLSLLLRELVPADAASGEFDLRDVVSDAARLIDPLAERQRVQVNLRLEGASATVTGHRDRIYQALLNIINNALEAMPDGGRLEIAYSVQGAKAEIRVSDTGGGISEKIEKTMFEKYVTTKSTGTGIGLPVARDSVIEDGGEFGYVNRRGHGATFWMAMPLLSHS